MGLFVSFAGLGGGHVGVDLGRAKALVAEKLLNDPEVGAAIQQVSGEAVAKGVGMGGLDEAPLQRVLADKGLDASDGEPTATVVEEEGSVLGVVRKLRSSVGEIAGYGIEGLPPDHDVPLLGTLAQDPELAVAVGYVIGVKADYFTDSEAGGVDQLQEGRGPAARGG